MLRNASGKPPQNCSTCSNACSDSASFSSICSPPLRVRVRRSYSARKHALGNSSSSGSSRCGTTSPYSKLFRVVTITRVSPTRVWSNNTPRGLAPAGQPASLPRCRSSVLSSTNSVSLDQGASFSLRFSSTCSADRSLRPLAGAATFSSSSITCSTRRSAAWSEPTPRKPTHAAWYVLPRSKATPATASATDVLPTPGRPCSSWRDCCWP
mmetsp:Transcript_2375/g.8496  ORF Transcript_2375/g.8496 Transcript_2375/m.8496 type:complete len:210 (-) Transcript_2375:789-1418(-)